MDNPWATRSLIAEALISISGLSISITRRDKPGTMASKALRLGRGEPGLGTATKLHIVINRDGSRH